MKLGVGRIDAAFIQRVNRLADDIATRIKEMNECGTSAASTPPAPFPSKGRIFLAAVPGEMEEVRSELVSALKAAEWAVEPEANICPADVETCRQEVLAALKTGGDSLAYLQIVGAYPWLPGGHDRAQYEASEGAPKRFVYRMDDIDLKKVRNADHRSWLEELPAKSIPYLKEKIPMELEEWLRQRQIKPVTQVLSGKAVAAYITISAASHEGALGRKLMSEFKAQSIYADLGGTTETSIKEAFLELDGFLAVFGNEGYSRVESVLRQWRRVLRDFGRSPGENPPLGLLLTDPPPQDKREVITMELPDMEVFEASDVAGRARFVAKALQFAAKKGGAS
jgi:hypothetical protein